MRKLDLEQNIHSGTSILTSPLLQAELEPCLLNCQVRPIVMEGRYHPVAFLGQRTNFPVVQWMLPLHPELCNPQV